MKELIDERQKRMVQLLYKAELKESEYIDIFKGVDMDSEDKYYLDAMAKIASENKWFGVPKEICPRLMGMRKLRKVKFSAMIPEALKLFSLWNDKGYRWMLFRDTALQMSNLSDEILDITRLSVKIDLNDSAMAIKCASQLGFVSQKIGNARVLKKDCCEIELAGDILNGDVFSFDSLFKRSETKTFHNVLVRIPSKEDMFLLQMKQAYDLYIVYFSNDKVFYWICKMIYLIKDIDWQKIEEIQFQCTDQIYFGVMASILSKTVEGVDVKTTESINFLLKIQNERFDVKKECERQQRIFLKGKKIKRSDNMILKKINDMRRKILRYCLHKEK